MEKNYNQPLVVNVKYKDLKLKENIVLEKLLEYDEKKPLLKSEFVKSFVQMGSCAAINGWNGLVKKGYILPIKIQGNSFKYGVIIGGSLVKEFNGEIKYKLPPKSLRKDSYVYLYTHEGNKNIKIGITSNLKNRRTSLNVGSGYNGRYLFHAKTSRELETTLHWIFRDKRTYGEWFSLDTKDIMKAIEIIKENEIH